PPQTPDWEKININPNFKVEFNNAVVKYGRVAVNATSSGAEHENLTIRNSEISHASTGIYMENIEPVIDGNLITKNSTGIISFINKGFDRLTTVSNNSFVGNGLYGVYGSNSTDRSKPAVDARNNWWNDANGPTDPVRNPPGKGDAAGSFVLFDSWLGKDPNIGLDPVIVIPGIMGSWEVDGKWQIDPIFHTYDNLCEEFLANGYEDGKTFSVFPYEWRDSNADNAKKLHARIEQIKTDTGRPKVDIVAHSMGGLLAREYIESNYYANDVDQLITVGTPQLGAPKDYIKWEAGAFFSDIFETAGKYFFEHEAKENGYDSAFRYIRGRPMYSVQELLPAYNYLYDDNGSDYTLRSGYPANYPRNEFLENLNNADKIRALKNVEFTKIVGRMNDSESTIAGYNTINADMGELWQHGYPHGFEVPIIGDQGLRTSDGDITVPLYSSESTLIPAEKIIYLQSAHNKLPASAQKDILEILTGKRPEKEINEWKVDDILIGLVFSPVDIQVVSPSGKRLGKNFETGGEFDEIEGAYYTGFDTDTEFLTIPNPEDGEYQILTEGTGTGDYTIETTKISEDKDTGEVVEATATITGTAEPDKREENKIKIDGDSVKKVKPLTFSPKKKEEKKIFVENSQIFPADTQIQAASSDVSAQLLESKTKIEQLDDLKNSVREYFKTKQIRKKSEKKYLLGWLGNIRVYLKRRNIL
ncbi:MAG: hypothetical protein NT093_01250, partial [Candidatus Moranbacteria bacterium]|nr:hypothetical protein [Candidatus Moranbacteria bacterium]